MSGLTLLQKYYGINSALDAWLKTKHIVCPVVKYGIDPATLKASIKDQTRAVYPYLQSYISNVRPVAWTSKDAGILTEFDYQLSYFTSPDNENINDTGYFVPFEMARIAFTDIELRVLERIGGDGLSLPYASILDCQFHYEFEMKSGSPVPSAFMLARMRSVCSYPSEAQITNPTLATDVYSGINLAEA